MSKISARYVSDGTSAKGGFGDVTFCQDSNLERKVAIKFIQDPLQINRLKDELAALLQMRSKHVVQVYDLIQCENGNFGIVEEFIEGDDLWQHTNPTSINNYLLTIWQIASGVTDIHEAGLIHRDIKLNNIKIDPEKIIKIYDFGLSRTEGINAKTIGFNGTHYFAAPELYSNGHVTFTQSIDTYAFGISALLLAGEKVLHQSLCSFPPTQSPNGLFSHLPLSIPLELANLLETCLLVNPSNRPLMRDVRDMIKKLILKDSHQALAVFKQTTSLINSTNRSASISFGNIGKLDISYDGLDFTATPVFGEVYLNNALITSKTFLPGSCVIAIGSTELKARDRAFITFDISNPEVTI